MAGLIHGLYNIAAASYSGLLKIASLWNAKAKKISLGRKSSIALPAKASLRILYHAASVGEFEQGIELIRAIKSENKEAEIIASFFSSSGYEQCRNHELIDQAVYLASDTPVKMEAFADSIAPDLVIVVKYELWPNFFLQLQKRKIPIYLIAFSLRPSHSFLKSPMRSFGKQVLSCVEHFYCLNQESVKSLESIGFKNHSLSGDSRADRVLAISQTEFYSEKVEALLKEKKIVVAGSTWPEDEALLINQFKNQNEYILLLLPHEWNEKRKSYFEQHDIPVLKELSELGTKNIQLITKKGILSSLYRYASIAYVGGAFKTGLHNTLEPAAYGLPILFGPNYEKFAEAKNAHH